MATMPTKPPANALKIPGSGQWGEFALSPDGNAWGRQTTVRSPVAEWSQIYLRQPHRAIIDHLLLRMAHAHDSTDLAEAQGYLGIGGMVDEILGEGGGDAN